MKDGQTMDLAPGDAILVNFPQELLDLLVKLQVMFVEFFCRPVADRTGRCFLEALYGHYTATQVNLFAVVLHIAAKV